ncbi:MAG: hypothetical protein ACR2NA_00885 [Solirubrobacterales bacterium]
MAVAGGLIGVIGSAAHPQPSPDELNVKAFLDTIVPSDSWVLLHLLILFSLFVGAAALVLLARVGALVLVAATAMSGAWMLLDGLAMKAIADDWAASTGAAHVADERAAIAIEHFILALFSAWLVFWRAYPTSASDWLVSRTAASRRGRARWAPRSGWPPSYSGSYSSTRSEMRS